MDSLKQHGLTVESMCKVGEKELSELIYGVSFHNTKAKNIIATSKMLRDKFNGKVPSKLDDVLSLKGVGPKMAMLLMQSAFGKVEGIGVDTHVHRIANWWRWVKTTTPEATRLALETWLPREYWEEVNKVLVGWG